MEETVDSIKKTVESIKSKLSYSFSDYLLARYIADDGDNPDDELQDWIDNLPSENIIEYADEYAKECVRRTHAYYNNELSKILRESGK